MAKYMHPAFPVSGQYNNTMATFIHPSIGLAQYISKPLDDGYWTLS